ncbi:hypothetical protein CLAFUW4_10632 [Fulvia fulva]|uniref:Uncharacterized protein n=1 Tax=Passalora fulva TaxID=5499 RepID=A0A9Q8P7Q5_PASFU|nr:uncharacterized protein CLAFUR5_05245 [Fulvia fulva]KAK4615534.1 hypothetical protein CLAFUR4_10637 [Fulvia fulva]KAK4617386.1 hypothetical protein CLAFUR0_10607 [Fulvia fulva]UJO16273.1 hypothetical protein CLAFUR5_05245 [Fulvia fulva]WPV18895.1 hypothetical protein CLAFUW4_10632 [Fulvia fulva]WPV34522.1 hypothetical protein CLAFUW7_10634 [Fulvia fulva]
METTNAANVPHSISSRLLALPEELLLKIFKENCPYPTSSTHTPTCSNFADAFDDYLNSHSLTHHLRELALDAFFHDFVLEVNMEFKCFENHMMSWFEPIISSCGLEDGGHRRRITRARVTVTLQHANFKVEAVESVAKIVRKLAVGTSLKELDVGFRTCSVALSESMRQMLEEKLGLVARLARIEMKMTVVKGSMPYSALL